MEPIPTRKPKRGKPRETTRLKEKERLERILRAFGVSYHDVQGAIPYDWKGQGRGLKLPEAPYAITTRELKVILAASCIRKLDMLQGDVFYWLDNNPVGSPWTEQNIQAHYFQAGHAKSTYSNKKSAAKNCPLEERRDSIISSNIYGAIAKEGLERQYREVLYDLYENPAAFGWTKKPTRGELADLANDQRDRQFKGLPPLKTFKQPDRAFSTQVTVEDMERLVDKAILCKPENREILTAHWNALVDAVRRIPKRKPGLRAKLRKKPHDR